MGNSEGGSLAAMARLCGRIEEWRRAGRPGKRMPEELWVAAVALAREHGACRVARHTGVSYHSLRERMADGAAAGRQRAAGAVQFVELSADLLGGSGRGGWSELEVERRDGARLRIRVGAGRELEVAQVACAFAAGQL